VPDFSNMAIAAAFDELADLYELDGAIVHRVLAYRTAAKSVRDAPVSVSKMAVEGRVTELPGIGKTLEEKILALVQTGAIPATEKLRAKFPAGLMDLTRLPGLGPKRARLLFDELHVDSLDALRQAAEAQRLRDVKGLGPKFESSVLGAFESGLAERPAPRVLLHRALGMLVRARGDLAPEDRHHRARGAQHVAEAHRRVSRFWEAPLGRLDGPLGERLGGAHDGGGRHRLVRRDQHEALHPGRLGAVVKRTKAGQRRSNHLAQTDQ